MDIITHIIEYKTKNNATDRQIAVKLDVSESQLSRWLTGKTKPRKLWAREIFARLKILK